MSRKLHGKSSAMGRVCELQMWVTTGPILSQTAPEVVPMSWMHLDLHCRKVVESDLVILYTINKRIGLNLYCSISLILLYVTPDCFNSVTLRYLVM